MTQMITDNEPVSRQQARAAVLLVLRYSPYAKLLSDKEFLALLDHQMSTILPKPDTMALRPLMDVLRMRAGFDVATAIPPLARLKTWEPWLRMRVEVPPDFIKNGVVDANAAAAACRPPDTEMEKVIPAVQAITRSGRMKPIVDTPKVDERAEHAKVVRRQLRVVVGVAVAVVLVSAGGFVAYRTRESPVAVNTLSETVPLARASRVGGTVRAVLGNAAWLKLSQPDREEALQASWALTSRDSTITVFELVNEQGSVLVELRKTGPTTPPTLTWAP